MKSPQWNPHMWFSSRSVIQDYNTVVGRSKHKKTHLGFEERYAPRLAFFLAYDW